MLLDSVITYHLKVLGSIGHPIKHTEIKVVDAETDKVLPFGLKGIVKVRGPQVMKGYYKVTFESSSCHRTSVFM